MFVNSVKRQMLSILAVFILLAGLMPNWAGAADPGGPYPLNWSVPAGKITSMAYGAGSYVAAAENGVFYTSLDGTNWTVSVQTKEGAYHANDVIYADGKFVAVGGLLSNGASWVSLDGKNWTMAPVSGLPLKSVTYGQGKFAAVGQLGKAHISSDGITWTAANIGVNVVANDIVFADHKFMAVGNSGTILVSQDGVAWSSKTSGTTTHFSSVTYGEGLFVAVGSGGLKAYSEDGGESWAIATAPITSWDAYTKDHYAVAYGNDQFVAVGRSGVSYSSDGRTWVDPAAIEATIYQGITYLNGNFEAWSSRLEQNQDSYPNYVRIYTSTDGQNWSNRWDAWSSNRYLRGVAYANGRYVTVGSFGTIATSDDGALWTQRTSSVTQTLNGVAYGHDQFVAVGDGGKILSSGNGVTWQELTSTTTRNLRAVAFGNGKFAAVGANGVIAVSGDGVTWSVEHEGSAADTFNDILYENGKFTAVGSLMMESVNGEDWTPITLESGQPAGVSVAYGNGTYVMTTPSGAAGKRLWKSTDGVSWTPITTVTKTIDSIAYGNGVFVGYVSSGGEIGTSTNGETWTFGTRTLSPWLGAQSGDRLYPKYVNESFVIVGGVRFYLYDSPTVTYDGSGGLSGTVPPAGKYYERSEVTVPGNPGNLTKPGYELIGWNDGNSTIYEEGDTFTIGVEDITLYAEWERIAHIVTFDNEGATVDSQTVTHEDTAAQPAAPTRIGHTFAGWYTGSDAPFDFSTPITAGMTLYAKWNANSYTVTYLSSDHSSGDVPSPITQSFGTDVIVAGNAGQLTKQDHAFAGWNTMPDGTGVAYSAGAALTLGAANVDLYAQWAALVHIGYNGNGATAGSVPLGGSYDFGVPVTVSVYGNPGGLERTGYYFQGWNTQADGNGSTYLENDTVTLNTDHVTLYAKWDKLSYAVTFETSGGSAVSSQSVPYQDAAAEPDVPVWSGYAFAGWYVDSALTQPYDFSTPITENTVLYAKWTANASNGGGNDGGNPGGGESGSGGGSGVTPSQPVVPVLPAEPEAPAEESEQPSANRITLREPFDSTAVRSVLAREQSAADVSFTDVPEQLWSAPAILRAARMGLVNGYEDGSFKPNGLVTRAEFAKMVSGMLGLSSASSAAFADVQGHWAEPAIGAMHKYGIITGYSDGSFRPDQQITRAEIVTILARLTNYAPASREWFADIDSSWAKSEINGFAELGIVTGKSGDKFDPDAPASRAEAVTILIRLLGQLF